MVKMTMVDGCSFAWEDLGTGKWGMLTEMEDSPGGKHIALPQTLQTVLLVEPL